MHWTFVLNFTNITSSYRIVLQSPRIWWIFLCFDFSSLESAIVVTVSSHINNSCKIMKTWQKDCWFRYQVLRQLQTQLTLREASQCKTHLICTSRLCTHNHQTHFSPFSPRLCEKYIVWKSITPFDTVHVKRSPLKTVGGKFSQNWRQLRCCTGRISFSSPNNSKAITMTEKFPSEPVKKNLYFSLELRYEKEQMHNPWIYNLTTTNMVKLLRRNV